MSDLNINVGANVTAYNRAMSGIKSSVSNVAGAINSQLGASLTVGGLVMAAKKYITVLDDIADKSEQIGVSTDFFQKMKFGAERTGTSVDAVGSAIKRLTRNIYEAENGNKKVTDGFNLIGVSVDQLKGKDVEEQFKLVAKAINEISDPSARSAAAVRILGKSAADLMPYLKDIDKYSKEAEERGIISKEAIKSAETLKDNFSDISNYIGYLVSETGVFDKMAVGIKNASEAWNEYKKAQKKAVEQGIGGSYTDSTGELGRFLMDYVTLGYGSDIMDRIAGTIPGTRSLISTAPITSSDIKKQKDKNQAQSNKEVQDKKDAEQRQKNRVDAELNSYFGDVQKTAGKEAEAAAKKLAQEEDELKLLEARNNLSDESYELYKINLEYDRKIAEAKDEQLKGIYEKQRQEELKSATAKQVDKELTNFFGDIKLAEFEKAKDIFRGGIVGSTTFGIGNTKDTIEKKSLTTLEKIEGHLNTMKNKTNIAIYG